ncbi:imelysin family protein [Candidatus Pseudomonas adelgestsugas]|uniref:Imelysin n=1 Tax=Candidatus Pseudomonas adelgestsugas TaxID=1302376 RepID=A0ABX5R978_9PSED|nr:imelysin family protein [Candidatus Pseudomonas adelgestsugas]QAX82210.1 Imelysin [Candidatus Pseudomonas adelgestsugas]
MIRILLATASLLAITIYFAGCDKGKDKAVTLTQTTNATAQITPPIAIQVNDITAKAVIAHYADIAFAVYSDAELAAKKLQTTIDIFLANPNVKTLKMVRNAWITSRVPYLQSEVFRFGNTIIDDWESQVNAWPLDEGLIDYVDKSYEHALGNSSANANIIANTEIQIGEDVVNIKEITPEKLASLNELGGSEANVATGYHVIEFLLWSQDLNGTGPGAGNRPASDYMTGDGASGGNNERRRTYLHAVTELLVSDLKEMVGNWKPNVTDNYRATLEAEPTINGLRKILFGMGSLSMGELAGERMLAGLEAGSPEDEQDCFSDNTHNSHFYNAKGIRNIYLGEYTRTNGTKITGASLSSLVAKADQVADAELKADLAITEEKIQIMIDHANNGEHYDQLIAAGNYTGNKIVRDAITALVKQTNAIEAAASKLGISNLYLDTANHKL